MATRSRTPDYQRHDYLGWIGQARTEGTRRGGIYMGMEHAPSRRGTPDS